MPGCRAGISATLMLLACTFFFADDNEAAFMNSSLLTGHRKIAEMRSHKTLFLVLSPEGASENRGESGHGSGDR